MRLCSGRSLGDGSASVLLSGGCTGVSAGPVCAEAKCSVPADGCSNANAHLPDRLTSLWMEHRASGGDTCAPTGQEHRADPSPNERPEQSRIRPVSNRRGYRSRTRARNRIVVVVSGDPSLFYAVREITRGKRN